MFQRKAQASVQIDLDGSQSAEGMFVYPPGGTVSGRVEIMPETDFTCERLLIQLKWETDGKGDKDQQVVDQRDIYQGVITAGVLISEEFSLSLPQQPWSYAGHYINIIWTVHVKIDVPKARDVNYGQTFILSPAAAPASESGSIW